MDANQEKEVVGRFHPRCGLGTEFSHERRVASGKENRAFAFSNDQIPIGLQFSVKFLEESFVRDVSPISASSDLTHQMHHTRLEVLCM